MKTATQTASLYTFLIATLFSAPLLASEFPAPETPLVLQEDEEGYDPPATIFDDKKVHFSGYGGPAFRFSAINSELAVFSGGKGGMIINDSMVLGISGYGLVTPTLSVPGNPDPGLGYGGLLLEYIFFPKNVINFSIGTLVGGGNANGSPTFFILEPEVNLFVNITRFFKLGISASYRYTNGLTTPITDEAFNNFSAGLVFAFGKF